MRKLSKLHFFTDTVANAVLSLDFWIKLTIVCLDFWIIDYLEAKDSVVIPIEVKAATRGSMQSLWLFMRKKALHHAVRTSLENFGEFEYIDKESQNACRHVDVIPLYAMSNLCKLSVAPKGD